MLRLGVGVFELFHRNTFSAYAARLSKQATEQASAYYSSSKRKFAPFFWNLSNFIFGSRFVNRLVYWSNS